MAAERISQTAAWADFSVTSIKGAAVLVPIGGVILALSLKPVNVNFHEFPEENVIGLLTGLIVVALFIERAVEVFLTPWRGTTCIKMTKKVKYEKAILQKENPESGPKLTEAESELLEFKGRTRTMAFLTALALGMTISASGVRDWDLLSIRRDAPLSLLLWTWFSRAVSWQEGPTGYIRLFPYLPAIWISPPKIQNCIVAIYSNTWSRVEQRFSAALDSYGGDRL